MYCLHLHGDNLDHMGAEVVGKKRVCLLCGTAGGSCQTNGMRGGRIGFVRVGVSSKDGQM